MRTHTDDGKKIFFFDDMRFVALRDYEYLLAALTEAEQQRDRLREALEQQCPHGENCTCAITTRHEAFDWFCHARERIGALRKVLERIAAMSYTRADDPFGEHQRIARSVLARGKAST